MTRPCKHGVEVCEPCAFDAGKAEGAREALAAVIASLEDDDGCCGTTSWGAVLEWLRARMPEPPQ